MGILITIAGFLFMEFMAWAVHKYLMHGPGWFLHRDHHRPHGSLLQRNDAFFLIFAIPSCALIVMGSTAGFDWKFYTGIGIAIYGFCYFLVHDVFIHQRLPWFRNTNNPYLRAIRKAHKVHHKHLDKHPGECFGMLIVPWKYYKEAWRSNHS